MAAENTIVNRWTSADWEAVQQRAVNPYRAVEARAVNRLTRVVTKGSSMSLGDNDITFVDYKTINVKANKYVKDDVYIEINEDLDIDLTDDTNYLSTSYKGLNSEGTYWVVMIYTFINSIPYPYASIKIVKREEDLTDEVLVLGKMEVVADPSVVGGYAVDSETIENDDSNILHVDALKIDIEHALATKSAVNLVGENLVFTHDDPLTHTDLSSLDAQVQGMKDEIRELQQSSGSQSQEIEELQEIAVPITYHDLYAPGNPLEDLANYEPIEEDYDPDPESEPEPEPEPEPANPFEISSVTLDAGVLTVAFTENVAIHDSEMEHGVEYVTSDSDMTVTGYPQSYEAADGSLAITDEFSDTDKWVRIAAGLLETASDATVQENDIIFNINQYINA